jgi:hypothetical protein
MTSPITVRVKITTSVDLSSFKARLEGPALSVFEESGREMMKATKDQWIGWKYKGRNLAQTGRSLSGWTKSLQATEGIRTITFLNNAKGYYSGKPYAGFVRRAKGKTEEWKLVRENLIANHLPKLRDRLLEAIRNSLASTGRSVKVRENRQSQYTQLSLEG